jgi:hypothetical protein
MGKCYTRADTPIFQEYSNLLAFHAGHTYLFKSDLRQKVAYKVKSYRWEVLLCGK